MYSRTLPEGGRLTGDRSAPFLAIQQHLGRGACGLGHGSRPRAKSVGLTAAGREPVDATLDADDLRFTQSEDGKTLYVFAMAEAGKQVVVQSLLGADLEPDATVGLLGDGATLPVLTDSRGRAILPIGRLIAANSSKLKGPLVLRVSGEIESETSQSASCAES